MGHGRLPTARWRSLATTMTRLHVVTLAKNASRALLMTRWSLESQVAARFDHHIVTGPSNDATESVARSLAQRDGVFHYSDAPAGIYPAMQWILDRLPQQDLVWFLNAGDFLLGPNHVHGLQLLMSSSDSDWATSSFLTFLPSGRVKSVVRQETPWIPRDVGHQATIVRVGLLQDSGGFNSSYPTFADAFLMRAVMRHAIPAIQPTPTVAYALGGFSSQYPIRVIRELRKLNATRPLAPVSGDSVKPRLRAQAGILKMAAFCRASMTFPQCGPVVEAVLYGQRGAVSPGSDAQHWPNHTFDGRSLSCCLAAATEWSSDYLHLLSRNRGQLGSQNG